MATTVRVSQATPARAAALAVSGGRSIGEVVDEALEVLEKADFWRQTQEVLRRHPVELDENPVWSCRSATASTLSEARPGQNWLADFGVPVGHEQGKVCPALVVSADTWNGHASTVTVLAITRTSHYFPTRIELEATAGWT